MKVYTARQAILNRKKNTVAYELLFRDGKNNAFPQIDSYAATAKLLMDSQFNQGIKKLTSGKPALINYPEQALLDQIPSMLPKDIAMVEILETVKPSGEVFEACRKLFHQGYKLVLDDFEYHSDWQQYLPMVRLIKFDIRATGFDKIEPLLPMLKKYKALKLLAEKIETEEEFLYAKELGFDFFQGYFFCKPQVVEQDDVDNNRAVVFAMYQEVLKKNVNYTKLSNYFERDTSLAYKLLKFINSGLFPVRDPITSLKQALIYLGEIQVKKFVTMIITAHFSENKPDELTYMSIIRARFCELIAQKVQPSLSEEAFLTGLFSLLDVIYDMPMTKLVEQLPISKPCKEALIAIENPIFDLLQVVKAYESASWSQMRRACAKFKLNQEDLPDIYSDAIHWADVYQQTKR